MGLLTPKGKKDDKKKNVAKNAPQSKFISAKASSKGSGIKKPLTGGTQRGS